MNEMQESAEKPFSQTISDPLANAVTAITNAMQTDYSAQFRASYANAEEIRQLKRRLYAKLRGLPDKCIYDGYEKCTLTRPNFMPTVPEIIAGTLNAQKEAKRIEKNRNEAASLPAPSKNAKMPQNIRSAWEAIVANASNTESERLERLKTLSVEHEALLTAHRASGAIREPNTARLLCARCGRTGVLSHSVRGDGNWYCPDHFKVSL